MTAIKVCGVTTPEDALALAELGVSAIGLNLVPASPRVISIATARRIAEALRDASVLRVGVVADLSLTVMRALVYDADLGCLQLHGDETVDTLRALLPHAYKAVRIADASDVDVARAFPGDYVLVDTKAEGALGGTGHTFEWPLVADLARTRKLTLAGGLRPDNVGAAVRAVRPFCVDVASGVESAPGRKDLGAVRAFVEAVREADALIP